VQAKGQQAFKGEGQTKKKAEKKSNAPSPLSMAALPSTRETPQCHMALMSSSLLESPS
jgi:hypothetical protein